MVTFVVVDLDHTMEDQAATMNYADSMTKECGSSARTFKSALVWVIADAPHAMREEARKVLAWQAIEDEAVDLRLDETQNRQLSENLQKARRDLKESVWRSFKHVLLLGKDNTLRQVDLGLVHSSSASTPIENILNRLTADGDFDKGISVRLMLKNWSAAFIEWPTKSVRDAIYASPQFPRILKGTAAIQDAIAKGVSAGEIAYVSKTLDGRYSPFNFGTAMLPSEVEISEDVFVIRKETAEAYRAGEPFKEPSQRGALTGQTDQISGGIGPTTTAVEPERFPLIRWNGEVPPQKWMNFYTKVVSKFASAPGVKLSVTFEAAPEGGISKPKIEEAKAALRELGLDPTISIESAIEPNGPKA
jgi:hypothetical protein